MELAVLGVCVSYRGESVHVWPEADKAIKRTAILMAAIEAKELGQEAASKMVARLGWAAAYAFGQMGRAVLRPLWEQVRAPLPYSRIGVRLESALR